MPYGIVRRGQKKFHCSLRTPPLLSSPLLFSSLLSLSLSLSRARARPLGLHAAKPIARSSSKNLVLPIYVSLFLGDKQYRPRSRCRVVMFFEIAMKRMIVLQPHKLCEGPNIHLVILLQLLEEVNNLKCSEDHGYYVTPTTLESIGEGKVRSHTGVVVFPVHFRCIVFKPFKDEILHGEVKKIVRRGCFVSAGPVDEIFIHEDMMEGCSFHQCETIDSSYFRLDEGFEIRVGTQLRFRIVGLKWVEDQRTFKALGTINGHFLGCIDGK